MKSKEIAKKFIEENKEFTNETTIEATKNMINVFVEDFNNILEARNITSSESTAALINEFNKKINAVNVILYRKYKLHVFKYNSFSLFLKDISPELYKIYLEYG